jgi:uncharacterized protein YuzE
MDNDRVQTEDAADAVRIGGVTFDNNFYDRDVDVLYLHVGDPASAVDFDATVEGDHTRFGPDGGLVGLTILNAKRRLERDGVIDVTLPGQHLALRDLAGVFA